MTTIIDLGDLGDRGFSIGKSYRGHDSLFGFSVAAAGDVNDDGYADVMIGAPGTKTNPGDPHSFDAGAVYILYGKAGGFEDMRLDDFSSADGVVVLGADAADQTGVSVSLAGDFNGDGRTDLIFGGDSISPYKYNDDLGVAQVLFGKAGGLPSVIHLDTLKPADGIVMQTGSLEDSVGRSVSLAGDVNGDGFGDVIVGAPRARPNGAAYVVFGTATGPGHVDLAHLASDEGFVIRASDPSAQVGRTVTSAGDFNGDGYADLLLGDPKLPGGGGDEAGAAYVIYGKAAGLGPIDVSQLSPGEGFVIHGAQAGDNAGVAVSSAGDLNGDGLTDLLIGASYSSTNGVEDSGKAYVIFGRTGGVDSIDLAHLAPSDGFVIESASAENNGIGKSVASAGDVNGDGFDDIIIGANGGPDEDFPGYSYVIYGKAGKFAPIDLANLSDADGFALKGPTGYSGVGASVAGAGDVNADGFGDLVIGALGGDSFQRDDAAYIVFGVAPTGDVHRVGSEIGQTIHGGLGNDTLEGRGGDDVLIGAEGDDAVKGQGGNDDLNGGDGNDKLVGGVGDDLLHGGDGADRLSGGRGADALYGGTGKDLLSGGAGPDLFHFSLGGTAPDAANADRIADFHQAEHDLIDLSDYDADPSTKKIDDPFHFVGTAAFSGAVGELRYQFAGGDTLVSGDTNGDAVADFTIRLTGNIALTTADFLFAAPATSAHALLAHADITANPLLHLV